MKKSIIYLGIAALTFINVSAFNCQQLFDIEHLGSIQTVQSDQSSGVTTNGNDSAETITDKKGGDPPRNNPEIIGIESYAKSMEEIIAENNQIIESTISNEIAENETAEIPSADNQVIDDIILAEVGPVYSEKTMEEIIQQDSQIIESPLLNESKPCNFKKSKKS
ncbi:hypothetical protein FLJC2902T_26790 [Flavobacterium limnosediminis JC2902]|uniref:Secreted protein n=1 Tax=Flavobacterium limnosediminis JC2902 TaxID=1341181 RepID=V6SJV6_9FLAO|nr:hypothetical protein [Flavobacterium limnosediminis]ESU26704.1 hypothetical protein FLJC2902T_26790 [Flavobacterium limnosediminis JC2902]